MMAASLVKTILPRDESVMTAAVLNGKASP
jgi:hypothetical protein